MKKAVLRVFMLLAGAGFLASAVVLVASWLRVALPDGFMFLHLGIFVVWLPAVLTMQRLTREVPRKDAWKAALRGAPRWMQRAHTGLFALMAVNFGLWFLGVAPARAQQAGAGASAGAFSSVWMVFYGSAFAILYSALHIDETEEARRCANGHRVSVTANFCEECGAAMGERRLVR